ncbi:caspase-7-like [Crassostrea virginica]
MHVEKIVSYFKNDKIKHFAGKPKCFFIQACRGHVEQGAVQTDNAISTNRNNGINNDTNLEEDLKTIYLPVDANVLLVFATTPGYIAYRDPVQGSWFFNKMVEVFKKYHKEKDIEEMMIIVKNAVASMTKKEGDKILKQMPCTWSTLTKKLFFKVK